MPSAALPTPPVSRSPTQDGSYRTGRPVMSNQVIERKPNGQFAKGVSGNLGGNAQRTRHIFNKAFLEALAADFRKGGPEAIAKVRNQQPAVYMKICALLVAPELRIRRRPYSEYLDEIAKTTISRVATCRV